MCLIIDKTIHTGKFGCMPKIAKNDILVYKCLDISTFSGRKIITPYKHYPITFDENGIFTYPKVRLQKIANTEITKGIHAYYNKVVADKEPWIGVIEIFYAIIPKGSRYFIGVAGDIVSNNMRIFKTNEVYNKYAETHKVKSLWHSL